MILKIRRNSCLRHATGFLLFFFVLLSALASVNFDVCSIDFVMLLLNGVPFSIFVLIRDYCTHLAWMDFLMPQLCCPFSFAINLLGAKNRFQYIMLCNRSFSYFL